MKKISLLLVVAAVAFSMLACGDPADDVDFKNHTTNGSIMVRNNTSHRLVAFKGDLKADYLIGGIPAKAQNHTLPFNAELFAVTEDFPMILLTEKQYNDNINDLESQKNTPFTRVYVFWNKNGENEIVYEIAGGLGGANRLEVINSSNSINVELRVNGPAGETIGYAPAGILSTTLFLEDGNYDLFPVFKRYNKTRDVVETVYPKGQGTGYSWFRSYSFGGNTTSVVFNLKDALQNVQFQVGAAWIYVVNSTQSGVQFMEGSKRYETASGLYNVMAGDPWYFQIDMPKIPNSNSYGDSVTLGQLSFGPTGFYEDLQDEDGNKLETLKVEQGKLYTITVSGDNNQNTLKAVLTSVTEIDTNEVAGTW